MKIQHYTYLFLLLGSVLVPALLSFDKKVQYFKNLKYIFPGIVITAIFFWVWDVWFTQNFIWSFSKDYTLGFNVIGMPIEEWLFFLIIPYCCIFIYEVLKYYFKKLADRQTNTYLSITLSVIFLTIGLLSAHLRYTFITFFFSAIFLSISAARRTFRKHSALFYTTYLVSLIPFLVVNGILTSLPVVSYNPEHILNLRVINIPVEDFSYLFLMLLMSISIYEYFKEKRLY